jgi:hypothetical protein
MDVLAALSALFAAVVAVRAAARRRWLTTAYNAILAALLFVVAFGGRWSFAAEPGRHRYFLGLLIGLVIVDRLSDEFVRRRQAREPKNGAMTVPRAGHSCQREGRRSV